VVAYLRTRPATNVGPDKDSDKRQREAIQTFAKRAGYVIVDEFYDAARSKAPILSESARALCPSSSASGAMGCARSSLTQPTGSRATSSCRRPGIACSRRKASRASPQTARVLFG
jgi:hypothetical protein